MKRREALPVGKIIEQAFEATENPDAFYEQRLSSLWPEVVGPGINRLTLRRYVYHGTLHVYLASAVLKSELSFNRAALVEALNRAVGRTVISEIVIH